MSRRKGSNKLRAQIFNALSNQETLKILEVLLGPLREGKASEIAKTVGMEEEKAMAHLGLLREGQLLTVRRVGPHNYYRVFDSSCVDKILISVDEMLEKIEEMRRKGKLV